MKKDQPSQFHVAGLDDTLYDSSGFSAPLLDVPESAVRFSLKHCDTGKYCISKLKNNQEAKRLNKTLGHFEDMQWNQVTQLPREDGISLEGKGSSTHKEMKKKEMKKNYPDFNTFGHFRVDGVDTIFRVFGAQSKDLFYILMIDREGKIQTH